MHLVLAFAALLAIDAHGDDDAKLAADAWPHVDASTNLALSPPSLRAMIALLRLGAAGKTRAELDLLAGNDALDAAFAGETMIATGPGVARSRFARATRPARSTRSPSRTRCRSTARGASRSMRS